MLCQVRVNFESGSEFECSTIITLLYTSFVQRFCACFKNHIVLSNKACILCLIASDIEPSAYPRLHLSHELIKRTSSHPQDPRNRSRYLFPVTKSVSEWRYIYGTLYSPVIGDYKDHELSLSLSRSECITI